MLKNAPEKSNSQKVRLVDVVRGVAVPVTEWRIVPDGVACPRGCEYKMDMSTGTNMIRVLESRPGSDRNGRGAVVIAPSRNLEPPKSLLKRKRCEASPSTASRRADLVVVDDSSPSPCRPRHGATGGLALSQGKLKTVDREHSRTKLTVRKDGSREEARVRVKSREIRPKKGGVACSTQRMTSREEQGIRRLKDGRKVITETITLQKVTVLPRSPRKPRSPGK